MLTPIKKYTKLVNVAIAIFAIIFSATCYPQNYPNKPLEWVVPYAAGGGTDVVARTIADAMQKTIGQSIIINNKPGAATIIGAEYTSKAKPDGYTLMSADTATLAANPFLYSKLSYNPDKDFSQIGLMCRFNLILVVNPSLPVKNLKEFISWAKTQNQSINYGTPGPGSPHHLATELFKSLTGLNLTHIPYKGAAPAIQDILGGQIPFMFVDSASGYGHIVAGKLRPIGVANMHRLPTFPDIPTFNEQGLKGFEAYAWQGLVGPVGIPEADIKILNQELRKALDSTTIKAKFQALGLEPTPSTPLEMKNYARLERTKWSKIIQTNNIKLD